jgi:hypothetical protein
MVIRISRHVLFFLSFFFFFFFFLFIIIIIIIVVLAENSWSWYNISIQYFGQRYFGLFVLL